MTPSRKPLAFVAGMLLAGVTLALPFVASSASSGCAAQETKPFPDAGRNSCETGPFVHCQPVSDDVPSCSSDGEPARLLGRLPRATRYPVGCVVYYVGERDEQGDCRLDALCSCVDSQPQAPSTEGDGGR